MTLDNLINMPKDEFNEGFRKEVIEYEPDPEFIRVCNEYFKNIENDFETEWSQKKFKWFFKKRRQNKLMINIYRRYHSPLYYLIEKTIEETLSDLNGEFVDKFVDVKNIDKEN